MAGCHTYVCPGLGNPKSLLTSQTVAHLRDWERCWQTTASVAQWGIALDWFPPKGTWNTASQNSPLKSIVPKLLHLTAVGRKHLFLPWNSALQVPSCMSVQVYFSLSILEIIWCCSAAWALPTTPYSITTCTSQTPPPLHLNLPCVCPRWFPCHLLLPLLHTKLLLLPLCNNTSWLRIQLLLRTTALLLAQPYLLLPLSAQTSSSPRLWAVCDPLSLLLCSWPFNWRL